MTGFAFSSCAALMINRVKSAVFNFGGICDAIVEYGCPVEDWWPGECKQGGI